MAHQGFDLGMRAASICHREVNAMRALLLGLFLTVALAGCGSQWFWPDWLDPDFGQDWGECQKGNHYPYTYRGAEDQSSDHPKEWTAFRRQEFESCMSSRGRRK